MAIRVVLREIELSKLTDKLDSAVMLVSADAQGLHPLQQPRRVSDASRVVRCMQRGVNVPDPDRRHFPWHQFERVDLARVWVPAFASLSRGRQ